MLRKGKPCFSMSELPSKFFVTDLLFEILKWKLPSFEINENFTTVLDFINSSDHYFTEKKMFSVTFAALLFCAETGHVHHAWNIY